jgi:chemotaxis protein methyltransferase CheR
MPPEPRWQPEQPPALGEREFAALCALLERHTGITPRPDRKQLFAARLLRRLRQRATTSWVEYVALLTRPGEEAELRCVIDALTTHETSFFREARHFDYLGRHLAQLRRRDVRLWSAACSTGEEAWSLAMVAATSLGPSGFTVDATDVAPGVVAQAQRGQYALARAATVPEPLLKRWCLKGEGECEGTFRVARELRERARFHVANLCEPQPGLGPFDVAFLRNVLFYFSPAQQDNVVRNVAERLRPGGLLVLGHCERANAVHPRLVHVESSIYRWGAA